MLDKQTHVGKPKNHANTGAKVFNSTVNRRFHTVTALFEKSDGPIL